MQFTDERFVPAGQVTASSSLQEQGNEEQLNLREYWRIVLKHKWSILGLALVAGLVATLIAFSMQPVYLATTTMLIERTSDSSKALPIDDIFGTSQREYYPTQYEIMRSRGLAEKVAEKINSGVHPELDSPVEENSSLFGWRSWLPEAWRSAEAQVTEASERQRISAGAVMGGLSVKPTQGSQLVRISYHSSNPSLAAIVPNTLAEVYIESDLEGRLGMAQKAAQWLNQSMGGLSQKLKESERRLQEFREGQKLVGLSGVDSVAETNMQTMHGSLLAAQQERQQKEIIYQQVKQLGSNPGLHLEAAPAVLQHPMVVNLKAEESKLERNVSELSQRYGPKHPRMITARTQLDAVRRDLQKQILQVVGGIEKEVQAARNKEYAAQRAYDKARNEVVSVNRVQYELGALEREVEANRNLYDLFLARFKETDVSVEFESAIGRIVDPAIVPGSPYKPNKMQIISMGVVLGLILGAMLAFLLEHLNNTFRGIGDVESKLGVAVLGALPRLDMKGKEKRDAQREFLDKPKSIFSEAIRTIRTGVMLSGLDDPHKVVVVTSSIPGEGKSTVAMNMALALGQMEKVLLIDADMRRPSLARVLGLEKNTLGLSNLVAGTAQLSECIHKVEDSTVDIMPSGVVPPNPLELLSSKRFETMLDKLGEHYDRIIIDSAPVHAVSDSLVLSKLACAVVYVVKADSTPYQMAQQGVKRLQQVNAPLIGVTINQVETGKGKYGYGKYGYDKYGYSGYGYYAEDA